MRDKLNAIWHIIRAKQWVCLTDKGDGYRHDYSVLGMQPKGLAPAYVRADIHLTSISRLTTAMREAADKISGTNNCVPDYLKL